MDFKTLQDRVKEIKTRKVEKIDFNQFDRHKIRKFENCAKILDERIPYHLTLKIYKDVNEKYWDNTIATVLDKSDNIVMELPRNYSDFIYTICEVKGKHYLFYSSLYESITIVCLETKEVWEKDLHWCLTDIMVYPDIDGTIEVEGDGCYWGLESEDTTLKGTFDVNKPSLDNFEVFNLDEDD